MTVDYKRIAQALVQTPKQIAQSVGSSIVYGTVISIEPLVISIEDKIELPAEFFVLSVFCKDFEVELEIETQTSECEGEKHSHEIEIESEKIITDEVETGIHAHEVKLTKKLKLWRGLREGDVVNMIMQSDKQKYYVIEYQGLTNDTSDKN